MWPFDKTPAEAHRPLTSTVQAPAVSFPFPGLDERGDVLDVARNAARLVRTIAMPTAADVVTPRPGRPRAETSGSNGGRPRPSSARR